MRLPRKKCTKSRNVSARLGRAIVYFVANASTLEGTIFRSLMCVCLAGRRDRLDGKGLRTWRTPSPRFRALRKTRLHFFSLSRAVSISGQRLRSYPETSEMLFPRDGPKGEPSGGGRLVRCLSSFSARQTREAVSCFARTTKGKALSFSGQRRVNGWPTNSRFSDVRRQASGTSLLPLNLRDVCRAATLYRVG